MLELQHLSVRGLHVRKVPLAVLRPVADFLACLRKEIFPFAMPFGFRLPAVIDDPRRVRPMRHPEPTASRRDEGLANRTIAL